VRVRVRGKSESGPRLEVLDKLLERLVGEKPPVVVRRQDQARRPLRVRGCVSERGCVRERVCVWMRESECVS